MLNAITNLLPDPLHPAVVHLPIALTLLVPAFAGGALWAIHKGARPLRSWGIAVALLATLSLSAWASLATGGDQEDRVEKVVPKAAIHTHEEAAEAFLILSFAVLGVAAVGLVSGKAGTLARGVATAGTLALVVSGWNVGHSGGQLVYKHGAASAYTNTGTSGVVAAPGDRESKGRDSDDR